jgi:histidyl-tRNA synthetase
VWAWGPAFRRENPQAGRYRQFMQLDAECVGSNDPDVDVEMIALAHDFFRSLGLEKFTVRLNSLGDETTRTPYLEDLRTYFLAHLDGLTSESRDTLVKNPLRVLDSKREPDQAIIANAPHLADYLAGEVRDHFDAVQAGLTSIGVPFVIDPRLVRGLDYYTHTLFEFAADSLDSAQNAIGGGGHYNNLVEQLGGPSTPGIGFALGMDRILMACDAEGVFATPSVKPDVFLVGNGPLVNVLAAACRRSGLAVERAFDGRSAKAQGKLAGKSGAQFVVTVEAGRVWLKDFGVNRVRVPVVAADVPGAETILTGSDFLGLSVAADRLPEAIEFFRNQYR